MQKEIIYIDVDDDITAIIGKLKTAKHEVVALVPPKRIGALQSAVNLRLLSRTASQNKKHLVIVTSNHALGSLAASAQIPVAKNLQSKPELAEIAALDIDEGEDIIDGTDLPDAKKVSDDELKAKTSTTALGATAAMQLDKAQPPVDGEVLAPVKVKKGSRVPNFDMFRRKLFLIIAAVVLLLCFLIWAIIFAPHATVILKTRTTDAAVNQPVSIGAALATDATKGTLKAETRHLKKEVSIPFDATGKKDVGEKATGKVNFSRQAMNSTTIPAGTELETSGGLVFVTDSTITVPASTFGPGCFPTACAGTASGTVTAAAGGSKYNSATGSLSGAPGGTTATFDDPTGGGTDKTITVVTQADVDSARQKINEQVGATQAKTDLAKQFGDSFVTLQDALDIDASGVTPTVKIDSEATNGKAALSGNVVFTMYGVSKDQLSTFLDTAINSQIDNKKEQRIYDNGTKTVKFTNIRKTDQTYGAGLSTNGKIGPIIDAEKVKSIAKGKTYGEVQSELNSINGVEEVDVKFSQFWVRSVPNNVNKISVEFILNDA